LETGCASSIKEPAMGRKSWAVTAAVVVGAGVVGAGHVYASTPKPAVAIAPAMTLSKTEIAPSALAATSAHGEKNSRVHSGKGNAAIAVRGGASHLIVRWLCKGAGTITITPTAGTTWSSPCAAGWGSMFTGDAVIPGKAPSTIRVTAPAATHWRLAVSQI
jgi:hypothetical protein